jgi:SAM-dependent methyltransferase
VTELDVTNRFVLDFARRYAAEHRGAAILDFGCGAGRLVRTGLDAGLSIRGVDVYYAGAHDRAEARAAGLLGTAIAEPAGGRLPFADGEFDLVVNNQVMEHVADLDRVLREIHRVLKPGGLLLSLFPARDVWREGHIGIPFSHRLPRGSRVRFAYTWALRALGLGTWKAQAPDARQWTRDKLAWIDAHTHYRSRSEIRRAFGRYFQSEPREAEYIRYRLRDVPWRAPLARLLDLAGASAVAAGVFRKLAFLVIVSRKDGA